MNIGGLQKTSLLDYPDHISCIIWTVGCNFRCPFCYNKQIVEGRTEEYSEEEIIEFLKTRKGKLEAVVITGGEPLLHKDIKSFIQKVKQLGFLVKLDTNGTFPEQLQDLLSNHLLDYVAMDVKAPKEKYQTVAKSKVDISDIQQSIDLIRKLAPDYEFRTTFVPSLLEKKDIISIGKWLEGSKRFILQQFKPTSSLLDPNFEQITPYSKELEEETCEAVRSFFDQCIIRGA